ncbi:unnamed protein product [Spirodela intermedia]|uniref:14-3-3 domain-containing protein n=2 Tax=Spirodela intermedia TaxID=51605 RepID=A0A7I8JBK4_SPIIN|nr:unnamed protein product [Spirodela intermedia]CAA6667361.1 unnamed protein product [Spirodela intermedia]CAA7404193.1 unnamed protein product [Spirodela intermedia]
MSTDKERESQVYVAKLAEKAERYDEMVETMKNIAKLNQELTVEERNLLSVGYKNAIGARRASWRIMSFIELKQQSRAKEATMKLIRYYRQIVEEELSKICNEILALLDEYLIPSSGSEESIIFYHKMKGDYNRYLAEFKTDQEREDAADQALKNYQTAMDAAKVDLAPTNPVRLGLGLNFSVFFYEIMNLPERYPACQLAKQVFEESLPELDNLNGEYYRDSTMIMQLLRDNLTLWKDFPEEGGPYLLIEN